MDIDPAESDPQFYRTLLGYWMLQLREEANLTQAAAAAQLGLGPSVLSDYERLRSAPNAPIAEKIFRLYGVGDDKVLRTVKDFAKAATQRGKGKSADPTIPRWFEVYRMLERHMSELDLFALTLIPGLFQIRDYIEAVLRAGVTTTDTDLDRLIGVRMDRQTVLDKPGVQIHAVIKETALMTPVGGHAVMRDQVDHLLDLIERPNIRLRILPNSTGAHPSMGSEFAIVRFTRPMPFAVAYSEVMNDGVYEKTPAGIDLYDTAYRQLTMNALSKDSSVQLLRKIRDDYDR